jgi:hypothetical protein
LFPFYPQANEVSETHGLIPDTAQETGELKDEIAEHQETLARDDCERHQCQSQNRMANGACDNRKAKHAALVMWENAHFYN